MIYIIVPVHNRLQFTIPFLDSLRKQSFEAFRIFLVDDHSTDGTSEYIQEHYPEIILVEGDGNLWWTGSINKALDQILKIADPETDFILTLNNDTFVNPDYINQLLSVSDRNLSAITGSVSVDIDNPEKVCFAGIQWNDFSAKYRSIVPGSISLSELQNQTEWLESDLLPGRGILIPIKVFGNIGLFDQERFPHYGADEDFIVRAKKAGYKILVSTKAVVYSHIKETNLKGIYSKKGLHYWYDFFFSRRSSCNLSTRYNWAVKHSRIPPLYFLLDMGRIIFSQLKHTEYLKANNLLAKRRMWMDFIRIPFLMHKATGKAGIEQNIIERK